MNAPEYINDAHEALLRADDALSVTDVAREIHGTTKPNKTQIKAAERQLKELNGLGLIAPEFRTGGVPFYRLIAAPPSVVTHNPHTGTPRNPLDIESDPAGLLIVKDGEPLKAHQAEDRILTPEAEAEREDFEARYGMLGNCSCHISPPCGSCTHPGNPRNQEEDETAWMAAGDSEGGETDAPAWATDPALQYLAPEDYEMPPADPKLLAMANRAISEQLDEFRAQFSHIAAIAAAYLPDSSDISTARAVEIMDMAADAHMDTIRELTLDLDKAYRRDLMMGQSIHNHILAMSAAVIEWEQGSREKAILWIENTLIGPGLYPDLDEAKAMGGAQAWFDRQSKDAVDRLKGISKEPGLCDHIKNAIVSYLYGTALVSDRLRAELAAERKAREALQEQANAVDVKDAAVGYLIRVPKRAPILRRKPESARDAALSAVRAGAKRADVLAVVPVGTARRGAEWQSTEAGG